jgi:hypothetical protein
MRRFSLWRLAIKSAHTEYKLMGIMDMTAANFEAPRPLPRDTGLSSRQTASTRPDRRILRPFAALYVYISMWTH